MTSTPTVLAGLGDVLRHFDVADLDELGDAFSADYDLDVAFVRRTGAVEIGVACLGLVLPFPTTVEELGEAVADLHDEAAQLIEEYVEEPPVLATTR